MRFGRTSTGANTRPAPVPGLGLECDKFDKAALDAHFDAFIGALLREIGRAGTDRTGGLDDAAHRQLGDGLAELDRRLPRGIPPPPRLRPAALSAGDHRTGGRGSLEMSERFLWDLRQTAQELVIENHAEHLKDLGRRTASGCPSSLTT